MSLTQPLRSGKALFPAGGAGLVRCARARFCLLYAPPQRSAGSLLLFSRRAPPREPGRAAASLPHETSSR